MVMMGQLIPGLPDDLSRECLIRLPYTHFSTARSVSKGWKSELDSPLFHHLRKNSGFARRLIALTQSEPLPISSGPARKYAFTPTYRLVVLDPETGSWSVLPPPPHLRAGGGCAGTGSLPLFCQLAGSERELVVMGGWDPETWAATDQVLVYDFLTASWRRGAPIPGPRRSFFACASSDRDRIVFVAGGHDEEKNALKSALAYDIARDEWAPLPSMARERDECRGIFRSGKFHVIGGYGTEMQGRFGRCSEAFDVAAWKWSLVEEDMLEVATCPRTCVAGLDGRIYRCRAGKVAVLLEDGRRREWRDVAEIPSDASVAPHAVAWGEEVVVIGSGSHGGPQVAYLLAAAAEGKGCAWRMVEVAEEYSGQVQAACCLEV